MQELRSRRGIHPQNDAEINKSNRQKSNRHGESESDEVERVEDEKEPGINNRKTENLVQSESGTAAQKNWYGVKRTFQNLVFFQNVVFLVVIAKQKWYGLVISVISGMVLGGIIYCYLNSNESFEVNIHNQTRDEIDFDDELYGLENTYTQQDERVWYTFAAGIKSVIAEKPNKPSVFLLLYDNDQAEKTVICLVQDVTKAASKYLMKEEINPLIYAGAELNKEHILKDPGKLLVIFENPVKRSGAMIITNLEDVHPQVAANFHFFCDRYTPLVEKAIYLFTLKLKKIPNAPLQRVAEDALQNLWVEDLPEEKLHPLITRLTGNVLKISSDYKNC